MTRSSQLAMAFALTILLVASSLVVFAKDPGEVEALNTKIQELKKQRVDVLERAATMSAALYKAGDLDIRAMQEAQREMLKAKFEMASTRAEQIKLLKEQLALAKQGVGLAKARFLAATSTELEVQNAISEALHVEIQLLMLQRIDLAKKKQR